MNKFCLTFLFGILGFFLLQGQSSLQNIRGKITDRDTKTSLPGASILLLSQEPIQGMISDENGEFSFTDIPVGRHSLLIKYLGYEDYPINQIELNSGKELILEIELVEKVVKLNAVEISANTDKEKAINQLTSVSTRQFTVEETQRYAAALNDPGRMASSFAGVAASADGRNDIIIRGNSPGGLLWRMQGMDIPNPNHFSNAGSSGGGIAMVSNYLLTNSDFMTGAFPAEYGNALSGIFDLNLRKGNKNKREYRLGIGVLGVDAATEGPIKKGKSSYIVNYRYSTLSFLNALELPVLNGARYNYQDLSFHLHFDTKKMGRISLFGMGGFSRQKFTALRDPSQWENRGDKIDRVFGSRMGASGISHIHLFKDNKTFIKTVLSGSYNLNFQNEDSLDNDFTPSQLEKSNFMQGRMSLSSLVSHRLDQNHLVKGGFYIHKVLFNLSSSRLDESSQNYVEDVAGEGSSWLIQPFFHWRYKINARWAINSGFHGMVFLLNGKNTVEPRFGVKYQASKKVSLGFGFGQHSQLLPLGTYFSKQWNPLTNSAVQSNQNLDFIKSRHYVLGMNWMIGENLRLKTEIYYQDLYSIPVGISNPALATINSTWNFETDSLYNKGTGENYGLELTLEKFFGNYYYFLLTSSLFQSTYKGGDGVKRNTRYNGNYVFNFLGGKEFHFGKKNHYLEASARIIWMGGQRYLPIDLAASRQYGRTVYNYTNAFENKQKDYFRTDARVALHLNQRRVKHIISFDMQNLFNTKNDFVHYYDKEADEINEFYQSGLVPIFAYRIDF